jgi:putative ABC transport system permease protein
MRNALAILTLAFGIGASTAMFSFVHPMLLHPFLYPRADRLVVIEARDPQGHPGGVSWPEYRDYAKQASVFSDVGAFDIGFFFLTGVDQPEQIAGSLVTPNVFRMLGAAPALGRHFRDGEEGVVILSDACWKHRFGGDPNILGRNIALDFARTPETERYTVIGVMPPDFWMYYSAFEVFVPLPRAAMGDDRSARGLAAMARLRDGATLEQARSAVAAIPHDKYWSTSVRLWEKSQTQDIRPGLLVLAGGAVILLLIATANVAGLLLVRAQGRRRELAIRAALGATPWRVMRLLAGESLKLGVLAGGVGIVLAWWGLRIMVASLPKGGLFSFLPSLDRVVIDLPALVFAIGSSLFACLLAGILPAIVMRHADLVSGLKDVAAVDSPRARTILVTAEIALSVTLLAGAGLLIKTMERIRAIDPGFRSDHLLALRAPVPRATDRAHAEVYYRELQSRLAALPGVRSVALANAQPLTGTHRSEKFEIPGRDNPAEADYRVVTPNYFATLGIPIHQGRAFDAADDHRAVISESLARKYWPGEDPIGKSIRVHGESIEIVGICGDIRDVLLRDPTPILYRTWRDEPDSAQQVDIQSSNDPLALARAVNGVVRDLGGVVAEVHQGQQFIDDVTWQQKQSAQVLAVFAGLALALAGVGLYGVISLAIGRRTREIGIRVAIGAGRGEIVGLVVRETVRPVVAGLALGTAVALGMSRVVASMLYEVAPSDPLVLASVAVAVVAAAMFACLMPLRRALRVDPMVALRCD